MTLPPGLHGAHLRSDLLRDLGTAEVRTLIRHGTLLSFGRRVLIERALALDLPTRAAAGLLLAGPHTVLTSHTAALLHGCTAADAGTVHVLSGYPRQVHRRPGLVVHNGRFSEDDVIELDGLRTLALDRVIADMLCRCPRDTALACADQALAGLRADFRPAFKAELVNRIAARPDPRGRRRGAVLLDLATGLPASPAESRLLLRLFDAGVPPPRLQYPVGDRHRLGFAWPQARIAIDYETPRDELRELSLRHRGWLVLRADRADLHRPPRLLGALHAAFAQRRFTLPDGRFRDARAIS